MAADPAGRANIAPVLAFANTGTYRDVTFLGLLVPGLAGHAATDDLAAIWRTSKGQRFQNYRARFSILSAMNQIQCNCGAVYEAVNPKDRTQGQDLFNVEYSLSPNWSAKAEYLHLDLGTASLFSAASAASSLSVPISDDFVRAGVNYHW